ncbi:ferredoxin [Sporocytophaga myxococcoides]|uniref:ferredoxin n=1 Tax=Sporocytophaga myxococcoides TaxID=153721 RepID=UPI0004175D51|nr:ferredoxin [Sporocytophaga myxococcoides]
MIKIIQQREKCIGCNYCVEVAPDRWAMSKKDGKSVLIGSKDKKGFHAVDVSEVEQDANKKAAELCPVKIIQVIQK